MSPNPNDIFQHCLAVIDIALMLLLLAILGTILRKMKTSMSERNIEGQQCHSPDVSHVSPLHPKFQVSDDGHLGIMFHLQGASVEHELHAYDEPTIEH